MRHWSDRGLLRAWGGVHGVGLGVGHGFWAEAGDWAGLQERLGSWQISAKTQVNTLTGKWAPLRAHRAGTAYEPDTSQLQEGS